MVLTWAYPTIAMSQIVSGIFVTLNPNELLIKYHANIKAAQKKAVQDAAFDKSIEQIDDRPGRRTIQISLSLPTQFLGSIDERAKGLGISRAALIKQASALFLENNK